MNVLTAVGLMMLIASVACQNTTTAVPPARTTTVAPGATTTTSSTATPSPNATTGVVVTTPAPPSTDTGPGIQWYHFFIMISIGFLLVGAACYVTLIWQQNAIRDYKTFYEEIVKKIGRKRGELAKGIRDAKREAAKRGVEPVAPDPDATESDEDDVKEKAAAHHTQAAALLGAGVDRSGPLFGRLQTAKIRSSARETDAQRKAAEDLDVMMRRAQRERAERDRNAQLSTVSLLGRAVVESTAVDHSLQALERQSHWRSLRSLDLSSRGEAPGSSAMRQGLNNDDADATAVNMTPSARATSAGSGLQATSSFLRSPSSQGNRTSRYTTDGNSRYTTDGSELLSSPGHKTQRSASSVPSVLEL